MWPFLGGSLLVALVMGAQHSVVWPALWLIYWAIAIGGWRFWEALGEDHHGWDIAFSVMLWPVTLIGQGGRAALIALMEMVVPEADDQDKND